MPAQTKQARPMLVHCTIIYSADIELLSEFMSGPGKRVSGQLLHEGETYLDYIILYVYAQTKQA